MIALKPVTSKAMQAYGYDAAAQVLAVRFSAGKVHHYKDVPPEAVKAMEEADSLGSFFAKNIRSQYPVEVVQDEPEEAVENMRIGLRADVAAAVLANPEGAAQALTTAATHYANGAPIYSTTTFKDNGDPIMLTPDGKRSVFCDVDE